MLGRRGAPAARQISRFSNPENAKRGAWQLPVSRILYGREASRRLRPGFTPRKRCVNVFQQSWPGGVIHFLQAQSLLIRVLLPNRFDCKRKYVRKVDKP